MALLEAINTGVLGRNDWPPPHVKRLWEALDLYIGLRDSDEMVLRSWASALHMGGEVESAYSIVDLPRMLARASANLLFAKEPEFTASDEADQERLDDLVKNNELPAKLHRAGVIQSSEGAVWAKLSVVPRLLKWPIIEFVSPRYAIPTWVGEYLVEVSFVTEYRREGPAGASSVYYRLFQRHAAGVVEHLLFKGTATGRGGPVPLSALPETKDLPESTPTLLDRPTAVYIPNSVDGDPTEGVSDYAGVARQFFSINEADTIGEANARLTARRRAVVTRRLVDSQGNVNTDRDILIAEGELDEGESGGFKVLEYAFDADALIAWMNFKIDMTLTSAGNSPQMFGRNVDGATPSGSAMKLRMAHSMNEAAGKARYWSRFQSLLAMASEFDSRPPRLGGFGRGWSDTTAPSMKLGGGMPRDEVEESTIIAAQRSAEVMSRRTGIARANPEWDDEQIDEEMERIEQELPGMTLPPAGPENDPPAGTDPVTGAPLPTNTAQEATNGG